MGEEERNQRLKSCRRVYLKKALYTMNIYNLMLIEVIQTAIMIMG